MTSKDTGSVSPIRILVAEDDSSLCESLKTLLSHAGYEVVTAGDGNMALRCFAQRPFDVVLSDLRMPGLTGIELLEEIKKIAPQTEMILLTAFATVDLAVEAMKRGAFDFVTKPFKKSILLAVIQKALDRKSLVHENFQLRRRLELCEARKAVIASSGAMQQVMKLVDQVAPTSSTVLITGESGTGKEVIGEEIHRRSHRAGRSLVKVSCAALPETLLESELFGHEKGAFTGALASRAGRFELANGGSLFLDEIGEIPLHVQVKLLRVLQDGHFERVGGTRTLFSDARIIAATNRDLKEAIAEKSFREDLYYRLNVIQIEVPPLRERPEDIPLLAHHFLSVYCARIGKPALSFSDAFMNSLIQYSWPGNVRELENTIERAVVMARDTQIDVTLLPEPMKSPHQGTIWLSFPIGSTLEEIETRAIENALEHTEGDKERAAKLLGITPRTIYRYLNQKRKSALSNCQENSTENPPV